VPATGRGVRCNQALGEAKCPLVKLLLCLHLIVPDGYSDSEDRHGFNCRSPAGRKCAGQQDHDDNEDSKLLQSDEVAYGYFGAYAKMVATAAMRTI
jgi:hypothetical protein